MRIGRLRHRIEIQTPTELKNSMGEPVKTWGTYRKCWASVEPLRGREMWAAQEHQARVTTRIRTRYIPDVTPKMRVLFGDKLYEIDAVINPEFRNEQLQLMCSEWVAV